MGLLLLIPGIILLAVNPEWFSGQDTVGIVLAVVGAVLLLGQAYVSFKALKQYNEIKREVNQGFNRPFDRL